MPNTASGSHSRPGSTVPSLQPKIACIHSAVKANASPSSRESRLKEAARCSVMGSRAAAANTRLPNGAALTASAANKANTIKFAVRPSISAGTKPR